MSGRFQKGAKTGGARPGAGRKPDIVRKALQEVLHSKIETDADKRTIVEMAWDTIVAALNDRVNDRSGKPHVSKVAAFTADRVVDRVHGKPKQTHEVNISGGVIIQKTEAALAAAKASRRIAKPDPKEA